MPDLLLAPYLPLQTPASVGDWDLIPFSGLSDADHVPDELRGPVQRLIDAYTLPRTGGVGLGAAIVPHGTRVGAPFERSTIGKLDRALLAGVIANNPRLTDPEEDAGPNAGYAIATAENAQVYGHPLGDGETYVLQSGVLAQALNASYAPADEPLPKIAPPLELPKPAFTGLDTEIASATFDALTDDQSGPRLRRTLDWYRIAFSNTSAITPDVRVGAARSALEVLTGVSDETKKLVRAYGRLLRTDKTVENTYEEVFWAKGPVQLTPDEWWLTRLSELRNTIVHGNEIAEALWHHDDHHQILQIHDRLLDVLRLVVAGHAHDPALRLPSSERSFDRAAQAAYQMLRAANVQDAPKPEQGDAEDALEPPPAP